ncbi:hypothetical protein IKW73_00445 [Candidatus Saccharibacteria bacterium]|nr:hypothetical protein [Candidatus Saccharibacteria bacterium]
MKDSLKKRGQKFVKKFSRASEKAREESKEHIKENVFARVSHIGNIKLLIFEWCLLAAALIMLASAQAFWFASSYSEDVFIAGGTYTEATVGAVNSMNPLFAMTSSEQVLSRLMFATLVKNDYSGHPGMGLAEYVTPSEDGRVWTMGLKSGIKWSDGEDLTVDDVMFTLELVQNPLVNSIYDAKLAGVKISQNENNEIVFTLPSAYADFISLLDIPVVPKHELEDASPRTLVEDDFSITPVTSGPFTLNATQTTTSDVERVIYLSGNPNYYLGKPLLNSFAVHTYEDKEAVKRAVRSGVVTATAEFDENEAEELATGQYLKKESGIDWGAFIFFNLKNGALKNKELRVAIRKGIDISKIREAAPDNTPLNYPITDAQIKLDKYPSLPERDYEASAAKIAEIKGENTLSLNVTTVNSGNLPQVATALSEELRALGIESEVITYSETQEFVTNIISRRNYDILVYEIELGADPDPLPYYHSSQASTTGLNLSNYRNTLVDDLLVGARESLDDELRTRKYESFLEYWVSDVPAIGLYQANLTYLYSKNVRTFGNDVRLVTALDRFVDVTNWASEKGTKNKTP